MKKSVEFPFHAGQVVTVWTKWKNIDEATIVNVKEINGGAILLKIRSQCFRTNWVTYYVLDVGEDALGGNWHQSLRRRDESGTTIVIRKHIPFSFVPVPFSFH